MDCILIVALLRDRFLTRCVYKNIGKNWKYQIKIAVYFNISKVLPVYETPNCVQNPWTEYPFCAVALVS